MANLLGKLFGKKEQRSGQMAKERLQLVLMHDRSDLSQSQVDAMKDEILRVIAKYVDFDPAAVEIDLKTSERQTTLRAEIPIQSTKRRKAGEVAEQVSS